MRRLSGPGAILLVTTAPAIWMPAARAQEQIFVETGDEWRYFKGTVAPPSDWANEGFDDTTVEWLTGASGLGYGDADDATVLDDMQMTAAQAGYVAFFARREFTVPAGGVPASLTLHIDYDDGFVAYLNGTEVARRGLGTDGTPVTFDQLATSHDAGTPEYIAISVASMHDGVNTLAIELHNTAIGSTDASLIPRLLGDAIVPPSAVACARPLATGPVTVGWTNNGAYASLRVERNGQSIATLAGTDATYTDAAPTVLDNVYRVVAVVAGTDYVSLNTCLAACTQGTLTCSPELVAGVTEVNLAWSGVPDVTSVQINREGAALATLTAGETSYTDPNVENLEVEDDTDYTVILTTAAGATCTLACQVPLCPTLTASVVDDTVVLTIGNLVKGWDHLEISRNGVIVDAAVPPDTTTWTDPDVVLSPGSSYDYLLHPVPPVGREFPAPGTQCDILHVLGYIPAIGRYEAPAGGWDYLIEFTGPGDRQYNPVAGESGNLDGRWIRSIDRDLWNGQGPNDPTGPAPEGPAPGGVDVVNRPALGQCGSDASVLRILDPGDTAIPDPGQLGTAFPLPFNGGLNSRIVLGFDLGVIDQNVLKSGVTLMTRLRLSPDAPAYMIANPTSGDGGGIAGGIGHVGVYFRQDGSLPDEGLTAGASVSLNSGANGGDLVLSAGGLDVDSVGALNFVTLWMTVVGGATPDTYDVSCYLNGATNTSTEIGGAGLTLDAGVADFGPTVTNYLVIGSNDTGGDAMVEIDFVAYKLGVFAPVADPCQGEPPNAPSGLTATPGDGQVSLAWSAPVGGVPPTGYGIYRDGVKIANAPATPRTFTDTGRINGTSYCYRVRASAGLLESAPSNESCATPSGGGGTTFHRGDSNNDGRHNISDPVNTLNVLFLGTGSISCQDAADSNDDGKVNISDPVNSLNVLFLGTGNVPPPLPPESLQPCGTDPTPAVPPLGCASYSNC